MAKIYLSAADTAKLIRKALAKAFPGQKFSVTTKTYSMGASVSVRWTDGPTTAEVNTVTSPFIGSTFDGMIDLKEYVDGVHPETGETVHFGSDHVHTNRSYSVEFLKGVAAEFEAKWGQEAPEIKTYSWDGSAYVEDNDVAVRGGRDFQTIAREIHDMASKKSAYVKPVDPKLADAPMISPNSPTRQPIEEIKPEAKVGEFKGHPVISLPLGQGSEFSFGINKAKAILSYLPDIRQFAGITEYDPDAPKSITGTPLQRVVHINHLIRAQDVIAELSDELTSLLQRSVAGEQEAAYIVDLISRANRLIAEGNAL